MNKGTDKSRLFLIEFICALIIFCVTAAVCAGILSSAYNRSRESKALDKAVLLVTSAVDLYKATGDSDAAATALGGVLSGESVTVLYDAAFSPCESADDAFYTLTASFETGRLSAVSVKITDRDGGEFLSLSSSVIVPPREGE